MRKAERLFQLVNLVRVHQPISAQRLAERLGVSVRTVYRYVDDLSVNGIPLYGELGRGYSLAADFELPPLMLTLDEADALALAVDILTRSSGRQLSTAARSLLDKIEAVLPAGRMHSPPVFQAPYALLPATALTFWDPLHQAIRERQPLWLDYLSLAEQRSERVVLPLGLFFWGDRWTLAAWCYQRRDYRNFRLERLQQVRQADAPSAVPDEVDLADYLQAVRRQIENH